MHRSLESIANRLDMIIHDKVVIVLIEVGINSQDRLPTIEAEKKQKCSMLTNKLAQIMDA